MNNFKAKILSNTEVCKNIFNLKFDAPKLAAAAKPGQFVEFLCLGSGAPFLRRPFGLHRVNKTTGVCEILFKKLGRGTDLLSQTTQGDIIDVIGPLGNGFTQAQADAHFIAGGGMGIAPLLFLAEELRAQSKNVKIFLAARTEGEIPCQTLFKNFGDVIISTEDGSSGEKCLIDTPLERALKETKNAVIYACGPHGMLSCIAGLAGKYKVKAQVSLEEKMACGMGVCQGCPVELKNKDTKYKMVCKDGPVFDAEDVVW